MISLNAGLIWRRISSLRQARLPNKAPIEPTWTTISGACSAFPLHLFMKAFVYDLSQYELIKGLKPWADVTDL